MSELNTAEAGLSGLIVATGILAVLIMLAACTKDVTPISVQNTNNDSTSVAYLFSKDGCNIYRFWDGGYRRYFVTCTGRTAFDDVHTRVISTGKTTMIVHDHIPMDIQTVRR